MEVRVEGFQLQSWHLEAKECLLTKIISPFTLTVVRKSRSSIIMARTLRQAESLVRAQNSEQPGETLHGKALEMIRLRTKYIRPSLMLYKTEQNPTRLRPHKEIPPPSHGYTNFSCSPYPPFFSSVHSLI